VLELGIRNGCAKERNDLGEPKVWKRKGPSIETPTSKTTKNHRCGVASRGGLATGSYIEAAGCSDPALGWSRSYHARCAHEGTRRWGRACVARRIRGHADTIWR
jgi:hypothetical protein